MKFKSGRLKRPNYHRVRALESVRLKIQIFGETTTPPYRKSRGLKEKRIQHYCKFFKWSGELSARERQRSTASRQCVISGCRGFQP